MDDWLLIESEGFTYLQSSTLMADRLPLGPKDVHIWRVSLNQPRPTIEKLQQILSQDEQARGHRFHFEKDRQHFVVARASLRTLLARYLKSAPTDIQFTYARHGKPELPTSFSRGQPLHFNLSHSGNFALYAFTYVGEIGVDLEQIRPEFTGDDIARRFFSENEIASLTRIPAELRHEAFFNCWTRKEAFIKAKGIGLSLALDQFDVSLTPNEPTALLRTRWDEHEASRWSLKEINVDPGYAAAVAVAGHDWELTCFELEV